MRRLGGALGVLGGVLDLAGVGLIWLGVTGADANRIPLIGGGIVVCVMGVAFVLAGRLPTTSATAPIEDPIEALGRILDVRERSATRSATATMATLTVTVECVDLMPYEAEFSTLLEAPERGVVVAGARIPIVVDRTDPRRVERDSGRPVRPAR